MKLPLSILLTSLSLMACAGPTDTTTQPDQTTTSTATADQTAHDHSAANTGLEDLRGEEFDHAFLSMMVAHHQGALEMSRAAAGSDDPQVRGWAEDITAAQEQEIAQMTTLLEPLGGLDEEMAAPMRNEMSEMAGHVQHAEDPDRAFVEGMIPHHQSALDMARLAEGRSENPEVLALAQDIVTTQQREIDEFEAYLAQ